MPTGTSGNDSLYGGAGADSIHGQSGNDTIYGNDGNDELFGDAGNDSVYGGNGDDAASGGLGNDLLDGGAGADNLTGGQGADTFYGGTGNDFIVGDGQWLRQTDYSSTYGGSNTTLTVVNNAEGPITLNWVDSAGASHLVSTIAAGQTYSFSTLTSNNYILLDEQNYYLEGFMGAANQTVSYGPGLGDVIYGGDDADTILGQFGNDTISGDLGNDSISGGYGADSISGGAGNDTVAGDAGNDSVYGGAGNDSVTLGDGNDTFGSWASDESGNDTIEAGLGDDSIIAGAGNDTVYGGDGNDILSGAAGNDMLYGGLGNDTFAITDDHQGDTIFGGENAGDQDLVVFSNYASTLGVNVTFTGAEAGTYSFLGTSGSGSFSQVEAIYGTGYNDIINASAATSALSLAGGAGTDLITGGSGADTIYFGAGNDTVFGGAGNDLIDDTNGGVETGNNSIDGGAGNDTILAGGGNDTLTGGTGDDYVAGEDGNDSFIGAAGNDSLYGGAGSDSFLSGSGNDLIYGGADRDTVTIMAGDGIDTITGGETGSDLDTLRFTGATTTGATITFTGNETGSYSFTGGSGTFSEIEALQGSELGDTINASAATSGVNIDGMAGNDSIIGGSGSNFLSGGDGDDTLIGNAGADSLYGGTGDDSTYGGLGNDFGDAGAGNDLVFGGAGNDQVFGDAGNDSLGGGLGDDGVYGGAGDDQVYGAEGNDILSGDAGSDTVYGGDGNDLLLGGADQDALFGDAGNDRLDGGAGNDYLVGGTGNDRFVFHDADGSDQIADFNLSLSSGTTADQLDVSDLTNANGAPVTVRDVVVSDNGNGDALLTFPGGETVLLKGVSPAQVEQTGMLHAMGVPCFAQGTRILTPQGERKVEQIAVGDLVMTEGGKVLPVLWHGQRFIDNLAAKPSQRPVRLAAGGFGNRRDLFVSQQHGLCLPRAGNFLIRAGSLVGADPRARIAKGVAQVTYHHLLLSHHALIVAEGAWAESFYPGAVAIASLATDERQSLRSAILSLVSAGLRAGAASQPLANLYGPRCLPLLSRKDSVALLGNLTSRLGTVHLFSQSQTGESFSAINRSERG